MSVTGTEIRYLLGIDGGGTKTEFLLTDLDGNEIKRTILGPSNPMNIGFENAKNILCDGINEVSPGIPKNLISVFAGIAGVTDPESNKKIQELFESLEFGKSGISSDIDSALEVALKGKNGIMIIIGTGIAAFTQKGNERHRISGWGYLIDKGGSGFHLGSAAFESAFSFIDGRGGSEKMLRLIEERLEYPLVDSIGEIYSKGNSFIASFSPVVFTAYRDGDIFAEEILKRNTKEIAEIIAAGRKFAPDGKVVFCGGLGKEKEILTPFINAHLPEETEIEFCNEPTVNGAVSLAGKL